MPLYDLMCPECGNTEIDHYCSMHDDLPKCCGKFMIKQVPTGIQSGFPEFGITLTNVEEKPVHFTSKRQMREYERKHNVELGALL